MQHQQPRVCDILCLLRFLLLNDYYTILPGVEAIRLAEQLYAEFGPDDELFVRPSGVHKLFAGKVVYKDEFCQAIAPARYDPTTWS